jgi:hypothetical protein
MSKGSRSTSFWFSFIPVTFISLHSNQTKTSHLSIPSFLSINHRKASKEETASARSTSCRLKPGVRPRQTPVIVRTVLEKKRKVSTEGFFCLRVSSSSSSFFFFFLLLLPLVLGTEEEEEEEEADST